MRPILTAPVLAALALAAASTPAAALDLPPLCQSLHGLADAARANGGQPLRIAISSRDCAPAQPADAAKAFCGAAGSDADAMAWDLLRTCLNSLAAEPQVTTSPELVEAGGRERKRITHMAAKLGHGVWLDLGYVAGRYDLVVWAPREEQR
jgi:hypothetical protein